MPLTRSQIDAIVQRAAQGWSVKEMAAATGARIDQVRYQLRKLGLSDPRRRRPSKWTVDWAEAIIRGDVVLARGSSRARRRAEAMVAEAD